MANALILDAPPAMFDDFSSFFDETEFDCSQSSSDSIVRGVRRKDTASYDIACGSTCVHVALERRLGNPTMFIAVMPTRKTVWRRDASSEQMAEQIVALLVAHGADDSA